MENKQLCADYEPLQQWAGSRRWSLTAACAALLEVDAIKGREHAAGRRHHRLLRGRSLRPNRDETPTLALLIPNGQEVKCYV